MKQTLSERLKNVTNNQSAERSVDAPRAHVSEHLPQESIGFEEIQTRNGARLGIAMNKTDQVHADSYRQWIREDIDRDEVVKPQNLARVMNMSYNSARSDAEEDSYIFERPATYVIDNEGNLTWSANDKPNSVGMVLVREDGSVTQLGADAMERVGVIAGITPNDRIYLASNTIFADMKSVDAFKSNAFEEIINDDAYAVDIIRVDFSNTTPPEEVAPTGSTNVYAQRKEKKLRKLGLPLDATPQQIKQAISDRKAEHQRASANGAIASGLQAQTVAADHARVATSSNAHGFTDTQTAILDTMKARRIAAAQHGNQEVQSADSAIERARQHLNVLRGDMAEVAAKRQGRLFSSKNNKHADLEAEYDETLAILGKLECEALLNDATKTESEKNVGVIGFIFDEQQKLREATAERLKSTPVSKMIEWVNSGTKTQRILKGVAVGAGGVLIGAGAGALVGVAAGAGLAAAAAVTATSVTRFGRYYAKEDNKLGRGMTTLDQAQSEQAKLAAMHSLEQHSSDEKFSVASKQFKELFDADTKKEQAKRRKSARRAIGGVALGMVVGGAAAYAIGELADGTVGEWANRTTDPPEAAAQPVEPAENDTATGSNELPKQPEPTPELTRMPEYGYNASTVTLGEGWYQTFSEMGITNSSQQYALLNNQALMQELSNQGLAYPDASLGGWGINMTVDGKMPVESLKLIEDYAKQSGYDLAS